MLSGRKERTVKYIIDSDILDRVDIEEGDSEIVIPDGVKQLSGSFCYNSFLYSRREDCEKILRVHIPASLVELNLSNVTNCFIDLPMLREIIVDEHNPVYESIEGVLFENRNEMKTVIAYPQGRTCKEYILPEGVTNIRVAAFDRLKVQQTAG